MVCSTSTQLVNNLHFIQTFVTISFFACNALILFHMVAHCDLPLGYWVVDIYPAIILIHAFLARDDIFDAAPNVSKWIVKNLISKSLHILITLSFTHNNQLVLNTTNNSASLVVALAYISLLSSQIRQLPTFYISEKANVKSPNKKRWKNRPQILRGTGC